MTTLMRLCRSLEVTSIYLRMHAAWFSCSSPGRKGTSLYDRTPPSLLTAASNLHPRRGLRGESSPPPVSVAREMTDPTAGGASAMEVDDGPLSITGSGSQPAGATTLTQCSSIPAAAASGALVAQPSAPQAPGVITIRTARDSTQTIFTRTEYPDGYQFCGPGHANGHVGLPRASD